MSFDVAATAYQRFMGRYADRLAERFCELIGLRAGQRALDVGAGTGALTAVLSRILGADAVTAIEPSTPFVDALRDRLPGVHVVQAGVENVPLEDDAVEVALAQLVVHFLANPMTGLEEMRRVTVRGGLVGASVWDFGGGRGPLSVFWSAARDLDPAVEDESDRPGAREGHLGELFGQAGLREIRETSLSVALSYADFDDWWQPYMLGVGPAGQYVAKLDDAHREGLRSRCRQVLAPGPGRIEATAWVALGTA